LTKFAEEYLSLKKPEVQLLDVMGNEIIRGQVVAFSKSGRGERDVNLGVVTHITKREKGTDHHSYSLLFAGPYPDEHRISPGAEGSVVVLNDPLYSLNSAYIVALFEKIEELKGKDHGDLMFEFSYQTYDYSSRPAWVCLGVVWQERTASWKNALPPDYEFGVPLDQEQMLSVIDKKAVKKMEKRKYKARMEARKGDGKNWR
jgi:hypothetical protein